MKKTISIEINIPDDYEFVEFRTAKTGELYLDIITDEVQTASINTTFGAESDRPFVILKKKERVRRTFELAERSGIAQPGDMYSDSKDAPIRLWTFTTASKAYFCIWKEIDLGKKSEETT